MAKARSEDFRTPDCRLSYASGLFKPRAQEGGKPKYGCTLIFEKKHRAELEKHIAKVITEEWGPKAIEMAKAGVIKSPILAGNGREARNKTTGELHPGMGDDVFFIRTTANEERPPFVIYKNPNQQETEQVVYSGCYGRAVLNVFAWDHPANGKGVSFGLLGFQKHRDGESLGGSGSVDPAKWAETIPDEGDAPDATKNGNGAASLFGED